MHHIRPPSSISFKLSLPLDLFQLVIRGKTIWPLDIPGFVRHMRKAFQLLSTVPEFEVLSNAGSVLSKSKLRDLEPVHCLERLVLGINAFWG